MSVGHKKVWTFIDEKGDAVHVTAAVRDGGAVESRYKVEAPDSYEEDRDSLKNDWNVISLSDALARKSKFTDSHGNGVLGRTSWRVHREITHSCY